MKEKDNEQRYSHLHWNNVCNCGSKNIRRHFESNDTLKVSGMVLKEPGALEHFISITKKHKGCSLNSLESKRIRW